jgi:hypothetical protein
MHTYNRPGSSGSRKRSTYAIGCLQPTICITAPNDGAGQRDTKGKNTYLNKLGALHKRFMFHRKIKSQFFRWAISRGNASFDVY